MGLQCLNTLIVLYYNNNLNVLHYNLTSYLKYINYEFIDVLDLIILQLAIPR